MNSNQVRQKLSTSRAYIFGLVIIAAFALVALFAPLLAPHDPYASSFKQSDLPPMWVQQPNNPGEAAHPLGTDMLGRDIFSRYLYGVRTTFILALGSIPLITIFGTLIGLCAGYLGKRVDAVITSILDILQSLPGIMFVVIMVLGLRSTFKPTWINGCITLIISYSLIGWVGLARIIRVTVLQIKTQLYIESAISIGASPWRIISRHIFPNVSHLVIVWVINNFPAIILLEAILGYIGVVITRAVGGNDFSVVSWGGLFYAGRAAISYNPTLLLVPSLSLLLLSMSFILVGDHIQRRYEKV
jgi:ABC-type dipeptide/oligopeptide/nickel transport system permease subunit